MGIKLTNQSDLEKFRKQIRDVGESHVKRWFNPWMHSQFLYETFGDGSFEKEKCNEMRDFTRKIISNRRQMAIHTDNKTDEE